MNAQQEMARQNEIRQLDRNIEGLKYELPDQFTPYHLSKSDHENIRRFNKLGADRFLLQRRVATEKIMEILSRYTIVNVKRGSELASKGYPVGKELWLEHVIYINRKPLLLRVSIPLDCAPSCLIRTFDLPILRVQVASAESDVSSVTLNVTDTQQTADLILTSVVLQAGGKVENVGKLPSHFEGIIDTYLSGITPFTPYYTNPKDY